MKLTLQSDAVLSPVTPRHPSETLLPLGYGLLLAVAVTQQLWPGVAILMAIPIVLMMPVQLAFGLLALAVPFDTVTGMGNSTISVSFLVSAGSGAILLAKTLGGARLATPPRAAFWLIIFFLWTATSTLWAMNPSLSTQRLPGAAALVALYFVAVSTVVSDNEFRWIGRLIITGGVIAAGVSLYQFARGMGVAGRASIVYGQVATNSNELAASLILPLCLAVGSLLSSKGIRRVLAAIAAVLIICCTVLTMSRGALAALAVVACVYVYRRGMDKRFLFLIACGVAVLMFAPDLLRTRMQEAVSSRAQGRWDIWLVGFEVVKHHGLFGVGLDNFPVAFQQYAGRQGVFRTFSVVPHNIYLQAFAEAGILGFILLITAVRTQIASIASSIRYGRENARDLMIPYEAAAWAILTHALVANLLWRKTFWLMWIMVALAVQVGRRSKEGYRSGTDQDYISPLNKRASVFARP